MICAIEWFTKLSSVLLVADGCGVDALIEFASRGLEELDGGGILRLLAQSFDPYLRHCEFRYGGARALGSGEGLQGRPRPQQELPHKVPLVLLCGIVLHRKFEALEYVRRDVRQRQQQLLRSLVHVLEPDKDVSDDEQNLRLEVGVRSQCEATDGGGEKVLTSHPNQARILAGHISYGPTDSGSLASGVAVRPAQARDGRGHHSGSAVGLGLQQPCKGG